MLDLARPPTRIRVLDAGIAQLVERNLAKVEVASSNLVSRSKSNDPGGVTTGFFSLSRCYNRAVVRLPKARWQSGHAADCKSAYAGSIDRKSTRLNSSH